MSHPPTGQHRVFSPDKGRASALGLPLGILGACLVMLAIPISQYLGDQRPDRMEIQSVDIAMPPPPPPIEHEPPPPMPEEQQEPPELDTPPPQLSLEQLDLVLNPGTGGSLAGDFSLGGFEVNQETLGSIAVFEIDDLDSRPQARTTVQPRLSRDIVRANQGKVLLARIKFLLNEQGRPESPEILMTSIPGTEADLQDMILRWRFDPPMREGQPVRANYILPFRLNL